MLSPIFLHEVSFHYFFLSQVLPCLIKCHFPPTSRPHHLIPSALPSLALSLALCLSNSLPPSTPCSCQPSIPNPSHLSSLNLHQPLSRLKHTLLLKHSPSPPALHHVFPSPPPSETRAPHPQYHCHGLKL